MSRTNVDPLSKQKGICMRKEDIFKIDNISANVLYNEFEQKRTARLELSLELKRTFQETRRFDSHAW